MSLDMQTMLCNLKTCKPTEMILMVLREQSEGDDQTGRGDSWSRFRRFL